MFRAFIVGKSGSRWQSCRRWAVICDKRHTTIEELEANLTATGSNLTPHCLLNNLLRHNT